MRLLTEENKIFDLNEIPSNDIDIRYGILDYSDQENVDYYFLPLAFLEEFNAPCFEIKIGNDKITMPYDWNIIIGDINSGDLEIMSLMYLNGKDFETFTFNPISGFLPKYQKIEITNLWPDVHWVMPKLINNTFLAVPLNDGPEPLCAFFIHSSTKLTDQLDVRKLF